MVDALCETRGLNDSDVRVASSVNDRKSIAKVPNRYRTDGVLMLRSADRPTRDR